MQAYSRDLGSPDSTDYPVLIQTKTRARALMAEWIHDGAPPVPPSTTTDPVDPSPAWA